MREGLPPDEDTADIGPDDTAAHAPVVSPDAPGRPAAAQPVPGPPPGPPRGWLAAENPWPWLLLIVAAVAALLVWLLVVRGHGGQPVVPRVVGLRQRAAVARLTRDGYDVTVVRRAGPARPGLVFSQRPGAGSRLPHGRTVVVDVANGARTHPTPAPGGATTTQAATTTAAAATVAVPDVGGKAQGAAGGDVQTAGLVPDSFPVKSSAPSGTVVAQDPSPGTKAPTASSVRLDVSVGGGAQPSVVVPDVTGTSAAAARSRLWAAKLTVRTIYAHAPTRSQVGIVLRETGAGSSVPAFSQIILTVGR